MPTISVHVDDKVFQHVSELAEQLDRSKSWVVGDALKPYLEHRAWMVAEIEQSLAEVRSGKATLIPHDEAMAEAMEYAKHLDTCA